MRYIAFLFLFNTFLFSETFSFKNHFIFIDNKGVLRNPSDKKVFNYQAYIENILIHIKRYYKEEDNCSLTLYIHGGLNSFNDAKKRSKKLSKKMLKEGEYPLFISWEAEPLNNYLDHLFLLRNGERSIEKGVPSSMFVFAEDMMRSFARSPISSWNALFGQNKFSILREDKKLSKQTQRYLLEKEEFNIHLPSSFSKDKHSNFLTFLNPTKLMTAPLIDGLGKGVWDSMLRRTDLILNAQSGFKGLGSTRSETAVFYFLKEIEKRCPRLKINLIAHSMGTIIADNMIVQFPKSRYENIVYMASASSLKNIKKSIVPWLKSDKTHHFYNLTLHPYNDMSQNEYYDFLPRGSILIWIDEFLEDIHSFEDRRAGFWYNSIRSAEVIFPKEIRNQVHLTHFGLDDDSPQKHEDFDKFPFWKKSFWKNNN